MPKCLESVSGTLTYHSTFFVSFLSYPPLVVGGNGTLEYYYIVEESDVDMATKTFATYRRNPNFNKQMRVEKVVHTIPPENKKW